jgi:hypothetical protein
LLIVANKSFGSRVERGSFCADDKRNVFTTAMSWFALSHDSNVVVRDGVNKFELLFSGHGT